MKYKVVNTKGKKVFDEVFSSKTSAEQAIVDTIKGGNSKDSLKYYKELSVSKIHKPMKLSITKK